MHSLIRPVEAILPRASRQFGAKARGLAALARAGFPIPAAYVLSCEATDQFLKAALPDDLQLARVVEWQAPSSHRLEEIRTRVLEAELPAPVREALRSAFVELQHAGARSAVVRPSRIVSEELEPAVAGLHETSLALGSLDALMHAARRCWASLYTTASLHCGRTLGPDSLGSLALIVQAMVPAEASGTLWTANPLTSDSSEMTLEAVFGLGLGLRDASITADLYQIDRRTRWIRDRVVGRKERSFGLSPEGALQAMPVELAAQNKEALDDHTLRQMVELGQRLEAHLGEPREIEWAVVADAVYVLHSRPIAARPGMITMPESTRGRDDRDLANAQWLSLGALEPLSDVVTPLTWSALNAFCRDGLPRALSSLGVEGSAHRNAVRCHRGRPYVDLNELRLLGPGGELLVDGTTRFPSSAAQAPLTARELLTLPTQLLKYTRKRPDHRRRLLEVERGFHTERARLLSIDPRILSGVGLADTLFDSQRLTDRLMRHWLTATADVIASWGMLRRVLLAGAGPRAGSIELALLCGIKDLHRSDAAASLDALALGCGDEMARQLMSSGPILDLTFEALANHPIHHVLAAFLSEHGHRAHRDLELASPRWEERPGVALAMACSSLARHEPSSVGRRRAEDTFEGAQQELSGRWGATLTKAVMALVSAVRRDIAEREQVRGWVLQSIHILRRCVVDASRRLASREASARDDGAFLLTLDELRSYLRGEIRAIANLVALRRGLQRRVEALPSPPEAFVGYPQSVATATAWTHLSGVAVSPGVASGVARLIASVEDMDRAQPGDVLVLRQLDPAWAPLMCRARAVCGELGGPLSPGAVALRQYAVPAVSNLGRSLRSVRDGETLRVDADNACVERIAQAT